MDHESTQKQTRESAVKRLQQLWSMGVIPDLHAVVQQEANWTPAELSQLLRVDQRERWQAGHCKLVEEYLADYPLVTSEADATLDLIYNEYLLRKRLGHDVSAEKIIRRFPALSNIIQAQLQLDDFADEGSGDQPTLGVFDASSEMSTAEDSTGMPLKPASA